MILVDVSSVLHRMIFGSTKDANKIRIENNKYKTEDFIKLTLYYIISEFIYLETTYSKKYGELVLCFDDYTKGYWRKDVYPEYKSNRSTIREESPINYKEVFEYTNELFEQLKNNTPWKCVSVKRAEADDIILVLAKEYSFEKTLIYSPDKDFLQAQRQQHIDQYSPLTKKWMIPEHKNKDMQDWIYEHIILGDTSDGVPKVVDFTEFSDSFKEHIKSLNINEIYLNVHEFNKLTEEQKNAIIQGYEKRLINSKGEETTLDIFKQIRFGPSHIKKIMDGSWEKKQKENKLKEEKKYLQEKLKSISLNEDKKEIKEKIKEINTKLKNIEIEEKSEIQRLEDFLDSHPLYREHFKRNYILVMEEGIPDYIRKNILLEYKQANTKYNQDEFDKYLDEMSLYQIKTKLPLVFESEEKLDISNCGW